MFFNKQKSISMAVAMFLGLQVLAAPLFPSRTEAAIAVLDKKNIAQAIEQVKKLEAMLGAENKQLLMMIINQRKVDPQLVLDSINKANGRKNSWVEQTVLDHVKYNKSLNYHDLLKQVRTGDKSLDVVIEAWNSRLGDLEGVLNGTISPQSIVKREEERRKTVAQEIKINAQRDVEDALKDEEIKKEVQELAKRAMESDSQLEVDQITATIMARNIELNSNTNKSLSRIFRGEATDQYKRNVDEAVQQQILKEQQELARKAAESK